MKPEILFEDHSLVILDKPAGMVVNRAETVHEETLEDWIARAKRFETSGDSQYRHGIVHRLDKDTSGVMIIAKTRDAYTHLQNQFFTRTVKKLYLTLLHGRLSPVRGSVSLPLGRNRHDRERFAVSTSGKTALTGWRVRKTYAKVRNPLVNLRSYQGFSLVEATPETGRTHQIRVHFSHLQHPVVGDVRYCGKKRARQDRKWCPRQFLHAHRIAFYHPVSGKRVEFESPLAQDLKRALEELE